MATFYLGQWVLKVPLPVFPGAASAACDGKYAALAKYAGDAPSKFLAIPLVKARMKTLLGSAMVRFEQDLYVSGTVGLIECELVVEGNAAHQAESGMRYSHSASMMEKSRPASRIRLVSQS